MGTPVTQLGGGVEPGSNGTGLSPGAFGAPPAAGKQPPPSGAARQRLFNSDPTAAVPVAELLASAPAGESASAPPQRRVAPIVPRQPGGAPSVPKPQTGPGNAEADKTQASPSQESATTAIAVGTSTGSTSTGSTTRVGRGHRYRDAKSAANQALTAPRTGGKRPKRGRRRRPAFWRELPMLILVALLLTFLIQTFLARVYEIPSGSMETTLHGCTGCRNDRVLVDKLSYRFGSPTPGDVIVFKGPPNWTEDELSADRSSNPVIRGLQDAAALIGLAPPDEKDFIKRVIAVGGQTVACCDAQRRVTVDGKPLNEPYIYYLPGAGPPRQQEFGPVLVPQGELWVMGDSRNNSADSRVPGHGPIPVANVIGKARFVVLPFDRIKVIASPNPQKVALAKAPPGAPAGTPLALGVIGTVPFAAGRRWWRRRRRRTAARRAGRSGSVG